MPKPYNKETYNSASPRTPYQRTQKTAFILILLLAVVGIGSVCWIMAHTGASSSLASQTSSGDTVLIADIYQDGVLLQSISLSSVTEAYTFTIAGKDADSQTFNEIQVRPGSIGIISASCPDKLCVHQGFIDSSLLPITCLPNHLVIQLRTEGADPQSSQGEWTPDIISY